MNFRIREFSLGYVVQVKKYKFFGLYSYWDNYLKIPCFDDEVWYHGTFEASVKALERQLRSDLTYEYINQ